MTQKQFEGIGEYQSTDSSGLAVHWRIFGKGRPVLILGGGPGDASNRYLSLCQLLAPYCACILVDQRGTGRSTPENKNASNVNLALTLSDLEKIREHLGIEAWPVLGFSYGGFLASLYASRYEASVSALLLLDSSGLNERYGQVFSDNIMSRLSANEMQVYEYWSAADKLKADRQKAITEIIRTMMPAYFCDRKKSLEVSQPMTPADFDFESGDLISEDMAREHIDLSTVNPFKGPVLIMQGRQDPLGDSIPLALDAYYPDSKLVFIEKAGHYSWIEQAEAVRAAVCDFMSAMEA